MRRGRAGWTVVGAAVALAGVVAWSQAVDRAKRTVGRVSDTTGVTANNWTLAPAGQVIPVGEVPQGCLLSPDGALLAVANCGHGTQSVMLVDTATRAIRATIDIPRPGAIFHGLAFSRDGSRLYVAGGPSDMIRVIDVAAGKLAEPAIIDLREQPAEPVVENPETFAGQIALPDPAKEGVLLYPIGLALSPDGRSLWVAETLGSAVSIVDLASGKVQRRIAVGSYPYEIAFDPTGAKAYVSLWGAGKVAVVDVAASRGRVQLVVGRHPCALATDPAARRLYLANAHSDSVSILDTATDAVVGTISLAPYEGAPPGSMPNALAVSADGATLYVADAGNNALTLVALNAERTAGTVRGRVPTGWFPSGVQLGADGTAWVVSAKGVGTTQNAKPRRVYIASLHDGILQAIAPLTPEQLAATTAQVAANNEAGTGADVRQPEGGAAGSPIPRRVGEPSPIRFCLYIIKENRTYDQVFGDLPQGNGDPTLTLFGRDVTPNQHKLAEEYVLLDNFYCDGSVSVDGHQWAKGAAVADAVEKTWPLSYSGRGPTLGGPVGTPAGGWLWQNAEAHGISSKVIGGGMEMGADLKRVEALLADVRRWQVEGGMPQLIVLHLPNNHTFGTAKGQPTPKAMVAENDLAVGRLIEGLSRTAYWPEMAVFIVEDDAQDGPDHVDCHRSPALVVSPWVKRGVVDSSFYDQVAVLRTIELILGLPPMTQFDAAAMPMYTLFADRPTVTPYDALTPAQPLDEMNAHAAYGQRESMAMNWDEVDTQPWPVLNRILWHSIKGEDVPYPEVRQTRYTLAVRGDDDDE